MTSPTFRFNLVISQTAMSKLRKTAYKNVESHTRALRNTYLHSGTPQVL